MDPAILSAITAIIVAAIGFMAERERRASKKERAELAKREAYRIEESRLAMKMQDAVLKLATVTAKKVMNHKTNGDVEEAFNAAAEARKEYYDFINKIAMEELNH